MADGCPSERFDSLTLSSSLSSCIISLTRSLDCGCVLCSQHFADARLEPTNNHWSQVYDFNDPDKSGDNWKLLSTSTPRVRSGSSSRM